MTEIELLTPSKIIKSKRKTISLIVNIKGEFIVRAPINCDENRINRFIVEKADWIIKKRIETKSCSVLPLNFSGNETITLLGENYQIKTLETSRVKILNSIILVPNINPKQKLISFIKKLALKFITNEVNVASPSLNVIAKSISISSARTNWGSCSGENRLHFSYKLMLCPVEIIRYVVIHELCHIKVKNHSKSFWLLVENYYPNYKSAEKWLKKNRAIIDII